MSVKIILSNTFKQAYNGVIRELSLRQNDKRNVVIVPDKFSMSLEQDILQKLNKNGSFNIEIVSFTRFAAKSLKNNIKKCLTPEGSVMLLMRAIKNVQDKLTIYKNVSLASGFANEIYAVLTSVRNSGIGVDELSEKGKILFDSEKNLKAKLKDLALIYKAYLDLLADKHSDSSTRLQAFADFIPVMDGIGETNIFVFDFYNFTAPQAEILDKLIGFAKSVTIGFVKAPASAPNGRLYPEKCIKQIKAMCEHHTQKTEIIENNEILPPYKQALAYNLFSYINTKSIEINNEIHLKVATNVLSEVDYVAKSIRKLIIEKGLRYRDIGIITGDINTYQTPIKNIFSRYDIPFYIDKAEYFIRQPSVKFLIDALKTVAENYRLSNIYEFIKNPMFYVGFGSYETIESFENYCLKFALDDDDIKTKFTYGDNFERENAEAVRERIFSITTPLCKNDLTTVSDYIKAVNDFLYKFNFYEKLAEIAKHADNIHARVSEQIEIKLKDILQETELTLGEECMDILAFANLMETVFQNVKVSLVPLYLDCVFIGEIKESRYDNLKVLCVLGAIDGNLPKLSANTAILNAKDEEKLKLTELVLNPTKKENNLYELFYMAQVLIKPSEQLIISYPKSKQSGEKPPLLISQIASLFYKGTEKLPIEQIKDEFYFDSVNLSDEERAKMYSYKFATQKNGYFQILSNIVNENPKPNNTAYEPYNAMFELLDDGCKTNINKYLMPITNEKPKIKDGILLDKNTFSASRLETYFSCPYKYYFKYGLYINKREDGTLQGMYVGTIIHYCLEQYVNQKLYEKNLTCIELKTFIKDAINEIIDDEKQDLWVFKTDKFKNIINILNEECVDICENIGKAINNSDFKPKYTEAKIGKIEDGAIFKGVEIEVNNQKFMLKGYIDRIDTCNEKFTIIDYKKYNKGFNLKNIFTGECIQPLIYMVAVNNSNKNVFPCGLFYLPTTLGYKSNSDDRFRMTGFIIDDVELVQSLDNTLSEKTKSNTYPVSLTSKGKINHQGNSPVTYENFISMGRYVQDLMKKALGEIMEGFINPSPLKTDSSKSSCTFCDYASICYFAENEDYMRKSFPKIKANDFEIINNGGKRGLND